MFVPPSLGRKSSILESLNASGRILGAPGLNGLPWMPLLLVLIAAIVLAIPTHALTGPASVEQPEPYQLEPSWWEGLISRDGRTHYPLILVIEEVSPDHSFIGHMKWNPNGLDVVAIEGSAEGNHLTFIDTVMLTGGPGNVTGIKRDVLITGNRMTGTNTNMPGVVTLTAERQPWDGQAMPEYNAKAMKADFQRWKAEIAICRQAKQASQRELCWHSLAFQTQIPVFCNEVSDSVRCKEKIHGRQVKEWSPSVAEAIARRMKSVQSEEPNFEVLLKETETLLDRLSAAKDEARWGLIKQFSLSPVDLRQPLNALRQSDPTKYDTLVERFDRLHMAFAPFINALSEEQRYLLVMYGATAVQAKKEQVAAGACEEEDARACTFMGHSQYVKGLWAEAKDSYSKACVGKDEDGCFGLAILEAVNGDPYKARKDFQMLCAARTAHSFSSCHRLEQILNALSGNENLTHTPAPEKLREVLTIPFTLLNSADEGQRIVGEGMAYLLGIERPVDFKKADLLFADAASRGVDVFRWQSDVASEIRNAKKHSRYSGMHVWAEMKGSLLNQRLCAWNRLSEFQHQTTCTHLFKEM